MGIASLLGLSLGLALAVEEVLIDLDPGGLVYTGLDCDDDLALLMAMALNESAALSLVGVTACGGNAPLKHAAPGLERLLGAAGKSASHFRAGVSYGGHGWRSMHVAWPSLRIFNRLSPDRASSDEAALAASRQRIKHTSTTNRRPTRNKIGDE